MTRYRSYCVVLITVAALMLSEPSRKSWAASDIDTDEQVCDAQADYFLGMEDYQEAIRRHLRVIDQHPENALAHYHLGFAYGLTGRHAAELGEYKRAVELGLSDWELFLNLGLLGLENGQLEAASDVLRLATLLGPSHGETHFNLGLAYERRGMLPQAEQEILWTLRLDPGQPDARNTLAVIYAEQGNYARARLEWSDLAKNHPDYEPARSNLAILDRLEHGELKSAQRAAGFAHR